MSSSLKAVEDVRGVHQSFEKKGAHLDNDIHDVLVLLLGFPKGPHVEGADPQGQSAVDGEDEKQ